MLDPLNNVDQCPCDCSIKMVVYLVTERGKEATLFGRLPDWVLASEIRGSEFWLRSTTAEHLNHPKTSSQTHSLPYREPPMRALMPFQIPSHIPNPLLGPFYMRRRQMLRQIRRLYVAALRRRDATTANCPTNDTWNEAWSRTLVTLYKYI